MMNIYMYISSKWPMCFRFFFFLFVEIDQRTLAIALVLVLVLALSIHNYHRELFKEEDGKIDGWAGPVRQSINIHLYFQYNEKTWFITSNSNWKWCNFGAQL